MGLGGISVWQLLIVLAILVVVFGTKKLRSLGSDLGGAVKGFRKAMTDDDTPGLPHSDAGEPDKTAAAPDKDQAS